MKWSVIKRIFHDYIFIKLTRLLLEVPTKHKTPKLWDIHDVIFPNCFQILVKICAAASTINFHSWRQTICAESVIKKVFVQ